MGLLRGMKDVNDKGLDGLVVDQNREKLLGYTLNEVKRIEVEPFVRCLVSPVEFEKVEKDEVGCE